MRSHADDYWGFEHCYAPKWPYGWHHVAGVFRKEAAEMSLYLDGEAIGGPYYFPTVNNSNEGLKVGRGWTTGVLTGGVEEVRISDVVRYTGMTYIVPTSPFTCDEHTRALWHFDEFEGATAFHDACGATEQKQSGSRVGGPATGAMATRSVGEKAPRRETKQAVR